MLNVLAERLRIHCYRSTLRELHPVSFAGFKQSYGAIPLIEFIERGGARCAVSNYVRDTDWYAGASNDVPPALHMNV